MARRKVYGEQYEEDSQSRPIWWWFLCMPGAVSMWFQYMFPRRGQVYATGRRYRNRTVQFIYTMMIYALLAFALLHLKQTEELLWAILYIIGNIWHEATGL